jgi:RNA polymerase sigma factor (sigma-70 family)
MARRGSGVVLRPLRTLFSEGAVGALTDAQLLERFAARREESAAVLEVLMRRHGPMVLGVCRRVLRDEHDAEDAFQATFLVLARKGGSLAEPDRLGCWLYGVAYRTAIKAKAEANRRRAREVPIGDEDVPTAHPPRGSDSDDLRVVLDEELSRLPRKFRAAMILHYLEGRSIEDAARALDCPRGTVWSRLARARDRLRLRLTRRGVSLSAAALATGLAREVSAAPVAADHYPTVRAATRFAAAVATSSVETVSPRAVALAEGVIKAMFLTKMKLAEVVAMALLGGGAGVYAAHTLAAGGSRGNVTPAVALAEHDKETKPDTEKLQGTWKPISSTQNGKVQEDAEEYRLIFEGIASRSPSREINLPKGHSNWILRRPRRGSTWRSARETS